MEKKRSLTEAVGCTIDADQTVSRWREDRMIFILEIWALVVGVVLILGSPVFLIAGYLQARKRAEEERQRREFFRRDRADSERRSQEYTARLRETHEQCRAQATARRALLECTLESLRGETDPDKCRRTAEAYVEAYTGAIKEIDIIKEGRYK
jgi:uncharacterized membrane protein YqiK